MQKNKTVFVFNGISIKSRLQVLSNKQADEQYVRRSWFRKKPF